MSFDEQIDIAEKLLLINTSISFVKTFFMRARLFNQNLDESTTVLKSPQLIFEENLEKYEFYRDYERVGEAIDNVHIAISLLEQEGDSAARRYLESEIQRDVSYLEQMAKNSYKYEVAKINEKGKVFVKSLGDKDAK